MMIDETLKVGDTYENGGRILQITEITETGMRISKVIGKVGEVEVAKTVEAETEPKKRGRKK